MRYNYLFVVCRESPFGYRWESKKLPDWINVEIKKEGNSKRVIVHSRIHVGKVFQMNPTYSDEFTDTEILKDMSGKIFNMFGV